MFVNPRKSLEQWVLGLEQDSHLSSIKKVIKKNFKFRLQKLHYNPHDSHAKTLCNIYVKTDQLLSKEVFYYAHFLPYVT